MTWRPPEVKPSTLRRRANEKKNKAARRLIRKIKGVWPVEDPKYLEWIQTLPCAACLMGYRRVTETPRKPLPLVLYMEFIAHEYTWAGRTSQSQAAHVGAIRGLRQKCSDRETLPLCDRHHDRGQPEGHHDLQRAFWTYHGIDRDLTIAALNRFFELREVDVQASLGEHPDNR